MRNGGPGKNLEGPGLTAGIPEESYGRGCRAAYIVPRVVVHPRESGNEELLCPELAGAVVVAGTDAFIETPSTNNDWVRHVSPSWLWWQLKYRQRPTVYLCLGYERQFSEHLDVSAQWASRRVTGAECFGGIRGRIPPPAVVTQTGGKPFRLSVHAVDAEQDLGQSLLRDLREPRQLSRIDRRDRQRLWTHEARPRAARRAAVRTAFSSRPSLIH